MKPKTSRGKSRQTAPSTAPATLEVVRAFADTAAGEEGADALERPQDLSRWLARRGLLAAGVEADKDELERAHAVRRGLRALMATHVGARPSRGAVRGLERAAGDGRLGLRFDKAGPVGFRAGSPESVDDAVAALLGLVLEARHDGVWGRFKICARPGCGHAFYDASPSATGRWCTARCGDRVRAQTFRRRRRR